MSATDREEGLAAALLKSFPRLEGKVRVQRERRLWVEVAREDFRALFDLAADGLGFGFLCVVTGLDEGGELGFIYHLADDAGVVLSIRTAAPKADPRIRTVTDRFPSAHIYERELVDLLGAVVEGLPPGNRYPLPDSWPEGEYPLRKDWRGAEAGGLADPGPAAAKSPEEG